MRLAGCTISTSTVTPGGGVNCGAYSRSHSAVAWTAWSDTNEPRVATAQPPPVGKSTPNEPSSLSVTTTGSSGPTSGAPGSR